MVYPSNIQEHVEGRVPPNKGGGEVGRVKRSLVRSMAASGNAARCHFEFDGKSRGATLG